MDITEKDRRLRLKLGTILALLCTLASLFFVYTAYSQVADSIHANAWPVVRGVVLSSEVAVSVKSGNQTGNSYHPNIRYAYHVAGLKLEAGKLMYVADGFGKDWAMQKVADYPVDSIVDVAYNPAAPEIAVLETNPPLKWYLLVVAVALAFVLVFAGLALFFFKDVRKMQKLALTIAGPRTQSPID